MIGIIFIYCGEPIEVRIASSKVYFRTAQSGQFTTIDGLKLDKSGVIKEFPDLKDRDDWQKEARERFKDKIEKMETEKEQTEYIINDLQKFGYKPMYIQKPGHRSIKI